ncbi:MAG: TRAP transporter small permease [Wenzhouxiangella sp.]|nr:MAG: TRAP transporter small permease [Wenzhouxiangella sp.]
MQNDNWFESVQRQLERLESTALTILLLGLVGLGLTQIVMRNVFGMALPWADGAMRAMVLWLAMIAAVVAAGRFRHIRIDLLSRLLPPKLVTIIHVLMMLLTAAVCLAMSWLSLRMAALEYEFQTAAFLGVQTWMVQLIVPIGFALMAVRFVAAAFRRPPVSEQAHAFTELPEDTRPDSR